MFSVHDIFLFLLSNIEQLFESNRTFNVRVDIQGYRTQLTSWVNEIKRGHKGWYRTKAMKTVTWV